MRLEVDGPRDARWWPRGENGEPIGQPHVEISSQVKRIKNTQSYRTDQDLIHMCLYGADLVQGFGVTNYSVAARAGAPLSVNIVRSVIDTLVAKIVKSKPKPMWLTSGGDWDLQQKAEQLNRYTEGLFYEQKIFKLNRKIVRDAAIFGTGAVKCMDEHGGPKTERTFTPEIYANDSEAKYGDPRTLFHVRTMDRLVSMELFPKFRAELASTKPATVDTWEGVQVAKDQLEIIEAWHLPSGPDADDGRVATVADNVTLEFEDWGESRFPYAFLRYSEPVLGWYGTGLAQILAGKQLEINKLLTEIQRAFHLVSVPRVLVERGSKIIKQHFNNDIGSVLEYTGTAPAFAVAQAVHPEKFQHLIWLIASSYQEAGINAMTAAGQKDPTLKSGKAQMIALDVEDSRYADFAQAYEEFCLDEADLMLQAAKRSGRKPVLYVGKKDVELVELPDAGAERFALECFPVSALSSTPAMRMEQVQNLANAGWITPGQAKRLLDFPDLEEDAELDQAPYDIVMLALNRMLRDGEYMGPLPQMDLELALHLSVNFYLRAKVKYSKGVEPANLELVLRFMSQVSEMIDAAQQGPAAPPEAGGASPVVGGPVPGGMQPPMSGGAPPGAMIQ